MKKILEIGGFIAGAVLVLFGVAVIVLGVNGRSTVNSSLSQEKIVGTSDMTPSGIKDEATKAGLTGHQLPELLRRRQGDHERLDGPLLRPVHAHPRARGDRRPDLRADGPVRDCRRQAARHERHHEGSAEERPAGRERRARRLGHRDRV